MSQATKHEESLSRFAPKSPCVGFPAMPNASDRSGTTRPTSSSDLRNGAGRHGRSWFVGVITRPFTAESSSDPGRPSSSTNRSWFDRAMGTEAPPDPSESKWQAGSAGQCQGTVKASRYGWPASIVRVQPVSPTGQSTVRFEYAKTAESANCRGDNSLQRSACPIWAERLFCHRRHD